MFDALVTLGLFTPILWIFLILRYVWSNNCFDWNKDDPQLGVAIIFGFVGSIFSTIMGILTLIF